jgi:hypothetical protein
MRAYTIIVLAILLAPVAGTAEIYQWKDASGKVHYSDQRPPASAKQERAFTPRGLAPPAVAAPVADEAAANGVEEQEADFKQRQVEQDEARAHQEKETSEADERKRNCELAKGNLRNLQIGGRQVRYDPTTGERVYLSDDEVARAIKDAQRAVDEWCKPHTAQR